MRKKPLTHRQVRKRRERMSKVAVRPGVKSSCAWIFSPWFPCLFVRLGTFGAVLVDPPSSSLLLSAPALTGSCSPWRRLRVGCTTSPGQQTTAHVRTVPTYARGVLPSHWFLASTHTFINVTLGYFSELDKQSNSQQGNVWVPTLPWKLF